MKLLHVQGKETESHDVKGNKAKLLHMWNLDLNVCV